MATFFCINCGERMCNSSDDNTFEHFLIKTNVYNLEEKKYDEVVAKENKETLEWNKEHPNDKREMDTWFGVCMELGQDAWICPKCETMFIFKQNSNELESVYKLDNSWREKAEKSKKSCGCIVVKDNKILLIQAKNDEGELFWAFPKGKQEFGETDTETAVRETWEEVGLDVEIIDEKPIKTRHLVHGGTVYKEILLFVAEPLTNKVKIQEDEIEKINWVEIDKVGEYLDGYYKDAWEELLNRLKYKTV